MLNQRAPFPDDLRLLVDKLTYKRGWHVELLGLDRGQGSVGLTLRITIECADSYHPDERRRVSHYMIVPAAAYDIRSWRRWLFDQIVLVERHEAMEFFQIDGVRSYAPSHGPGNDPYMVREVGDLVDQQMSFRGELPSNPDRGSD